MPNRSSWLPVEIFICADKQNLCLSLEDAKNLAKNIENKDYYIKQLENLLKGISEPSK